METVKLLKAINSYLLTRCSRVYNEKAPQDAEFPYITYVISSSFDLNPGENCNLLIDIWDDKKETIGIETLVDRIDGNGNILNPTGLNRKIIFGEDNIIANAYRENRLNVLDPNEKLRRRQLRYRLVAHF